MHIARIVVTIADQEPPIALLKTLDHTKEDIENDGFATLT